MTQPKPEFHLQRVNSDGSTDRPEIYSLQNLPVDFQTSRRGFLGTGITAAGVLHFANQQSAAEEPEQNTTNSPKKVIKQKVVGKKSNTVYAHANTVSSLAITPNSSILASGAWDGTIKLWSLPDGKLLKKINCYREPVHCLAISPSGKMIASGMVENTIELWSLPDGDRVATLKGEEPTADHTKITNIKFVPDGKILVSASEDRKIRLWSLPDGKLLNTLSGHEHTVNSLAVSQAGTVLASGSSDKTIKLWSLPDGKLLKTMKGHRDTVLDLLIEADGKLLVSASEDKTVRLWSLPSGRQRRALSGHKQGVSAIEMLKKEPIIISGSKDKTIKLRTHPLGKRLQELKGHPGAVLSLAVTADEKILASADNQGVIILWDLDSGKKRSYLFDPRASRTDAFTYNVLDKTTGHRITYTLPCGSPVPAGATCTCNCVPGTFKPVAGGSDCLCNLICTCIPVCQAHRLLDADPVVRTMAEQLLLLMGHRELNYMHWAAGKAKHALQSRIDSVIQAIHLGKQPDIASCPAADECLKRLNHPDEITAIMSAQMLALIQQQSGDFLQLTKSQAESMGTLLENARVRPWHIRYNVNREQQTAMQLN